MSRFRERLQADDGVALVTALLAVLIISGLVMVMVSRSIAETRASAGSRDFETAIHAAEAASDLVIRELNRQQEPQDYYSVDSSTPGTPIEAPASGEDERAWALGLHTGSDYDMEGAPTWIEGTNGQAYAVRPVVDASVSDPEPLDVIYAVGAIPSFDAERPRIRVIKLQVAQDFFEPNYALLSDHKVTMGGDAAFVVDGCDYSNPDPDDCIADVHTNQSFHSGGSTKVHGSVSSAGGSCTGDAAAIECLGAGDGVAEQPIPHFSARDFYRPGEEQGNVGWYDLCPDKTIKEGSTAGPCTGTQLWPSPDAPGTRYRGRPCPVCVC
jgi:type II secretory pathway pseudopilin PulG